MEQEPIKIVIPIEEETPMQVERPSTDPKAVATDAGRKVAGAAKDAAAKAWDTDARRKVSAKLGEVTDKGVRYVGTRMADTAEQQTRQTVNAMQERVKQTDWEQEAKNGLSTGLKWLSTRIADLAERVIPDDEPKEKGPTDPNQSSQ